MAVFLRGATEVQRKTTGGLTSRRGAGDPARERRTRPRRRCGVQVIHKQNLASQRDVKTHASPTTHRRQPGAEHKCWALDVCPQSPMFFHALCEVSKGFRFLRKASCSAQCGLSRIGSLLRANVPPRAGGDTQHAAGLSFTFQGLAVSVAIRGGCHRN